MVAVLVPAAGLLVSLIGLGLDFVAIVPALVTSADHQRSLPDALIYFWTFYTHLTNLALVLVYLAVLSRARWLALLRHPVALAAMAGHITLVMTFFHFMLAPLYTFTGLILIANYLLHYVAPITFLLWWATLTPHGSLRFSDIPVMLAPGLVYVGWVLARGAMVGEYPYAILDVTKAGYTGVAIGVAILLALVAVFCAVLVAADRLLGRRRRTAEVLPSTK